MLGVPLGSSLWPFWGLGTVHFSGGLGLRPSKIVFLGSSWGRIGEGTKALALECGQRSHRGLSLTRWGDGSGAIGAGGLGCASSGGSRSLLKSGYRSSSGAPSREWGVSF